MTFDPKTVTEYKNLAQNAMTIFIPKDNTTVYTFQDKSQAEAFSTVLQKFGIVGVSGNKKFVAQHVENNKNYGVVLTPENLANIKNIVSVNVLDNKSVAKSLSEDLRQNLKTFGAVQGYYRNSRPSLENLAKALEIYAKTGELDGRFTQSQAHGQGSSEQPDSVGMTFHIALDPHMHGGVLQTIAAMREANADLGIANSAQAVVNFLKDTLKI